MHPVTSHRVTTGFVCRFDAHERHRMSRCVQSHTRTPPPAFDHRNPMECWGGCSHCASQGGNGQSSLAPGSFVPLRQAFGLSRLTASARIDASRGSCSTAVAESRTTTESWDIVSACASTALCRSCFERLVHCVYYNFAMNRQGVGPHGLQDGDKS